MSLARVTLADVARLAGVSAMTVSRVINNRDDVSGPTREKVQQAIQRLDYRPNGVARSLSTQRTLTLGLMVPDITNPFFPGIVRGAEDTAALHGYSVILCNTVEDRERERTALKLLEEKRVDGIIACSSRLPDSDLLPTIERHPALVLVNREGSGAASSVRVDDEYGSLQAVEHLLAAGRQKIGMLAGPRDSHSAQARIRGVFSALEAAGRRADPTLIVPCSPFEEGGYEALRRLLNVHPDVDGLICYNDLVAIGALQACRELKVGVPSPLAIVGCDDIRIASLVTPALTTLRVSKYEIGVAAVRVLLRQIAGEQRPEDVIIQPELVVRDSAP